MSTQPENELVLKPVEGPPAPRTKPPPKTSAIPVPFAYTPSDDGTDENLLILLHGLGDTHQPFANLGRQLRLPQTATLALRASQQIPYLEEQAFQWYPSFDELGETIAHPDPTPALTLLDTVIRHLIEDCSWPASRIHLFGFAQGGTVALEFGLHWWRTQSSASEDTASRTASEPPSPLALASIVSVSGPMLSFPTTLSSRCPTPVLTLGPMQTAVEKGYSVVRVQRAPPGGRMPASKPEWEPIMRFWSERLSRRQGEGLYEVLSGSGPS